MSDSQEITEPLLSLVFRRLNVSAGWIIHLFNISVTSINLFVSISLRSHLSLLKSKYILLPPEDRKPAAKVMHSIDWGDVSPRRSDIYILEHVPVCHDSSELKWAAVESMTQHTDETFNIRHYEINSNTSK